MGVKDLWPLLQGASTQVDLADLQGQTVAVDLSGWIFASFGVADVARKIRNPHIQSLFYKVRKLLKYGIKPVFVLEGRSPKLKAHEIAKRKKIHGSPLSGSSGILGSTHKTGFDKEIEECCELLDCMGVAYIQATGEAEATCAMLNKWGLVDACMTNDCDVFLFGAKKVYRNFSGNDKETCVTCYTMEAIEKECSFNWESLVVFALLVGCDYTDGVYSIGEAKTFNLLSTWKTQGVVSPLDRLKGWRTDKSFDEIDSFKQLKKHSHCGKCDHPGNKSSHDKEGCRMCETATSCSVGSKVCHCTWHEQGRRYETHKLEVSIRSEAIKDPEFPSQHVIDEFMNPNWKEPEKQFWWNRPDSYQVQEYLGLRLKWGRDDVEKKMLPLLTAWDINNIQQCLSQPCRILRGRTQNKIEVYEVEWEHVEGIQMKELVTLERKDLFSGKFPEMSMQFEELLKKTKDTPKKWKTQGRSLEEREEALKLNRKITDMFPLKKKTYLKRTDMVRNPDSPIISARKKLVFQNTDTVKTPGSATRTSPRKSKRPLRFGDSPASQPSVKKLFTETSSSAIATATAPRIN